MKHYTSGFAKRMGYVKKTLPFHYCFRICLMGKTVVGGRIDSLNSGDTDGARASDNDRPNRLISNNSS